MDLIPVGARFSAPFQTGPGAHPASYKMGIGSFPRVKRPERGLYLYLYLNVLLATFLLMTMIMTVIIIILITVSSCQYNTHFLFSYAARFCSFHAVRRDISVLSNFSKSIECV